MDVSFYIDGNQLFRLEKQNGAPVYTEVLQKIKISKDEITMLNRLSTGMDDPILFQSFACVIWKLHTIDKEK